MTRILELRGDISVRVTLKEIEGVWFVTASRGDLDLRDFVHDGGWGTTEAAVLRVARRFRCTIDDKPVPPRSRDSWALTPEQAAQQRKYHRQILKESERFGKYIIGEP